MRASQYLRQGFLTLVFLVLASCGGSDSTPRVSVAFPSKVLVTGVVTLDGGATTGATGYSWVLTSRPAGSAATIVNPAGAVATFTADVAGDYAIMFTASNATKSGNASFVVTAVAQTPPTIISDIVEPLSGSVMLSLSPVQGANVAWTADGTTISSGATVAWDTTTVANGSHLVVAVVQYSGYTVAYSRTFQVAQTTVSFSSQTITESAGTYTATIGAASANGILRVTAALDGGAVTTLTAPNVCIDPTGAACASTGPNGYGFSGTVASGSHVLLVTATDGANNALSTQLRLSVTDVP